jgi:hypothetical protein
VGKHSGQPKFEDPNSKENIKAREEIQIDMSPARVAEDVQIIDQGYNQVYYAKGNKK